MPPLEPVAAVWASSRPYHQTGGADQLHRDYELAAWAERIRAYRQEGAVLYVYFNNDPHGHALADARRLRALLAGRARATRRRPHRVWDPAGTIGSTSSLGRRRSGGPKA